MNARNPLDHHETFVTTSEAGQLLGISQRTVHYWIQRGVLQSWKTEGGHRRIPMSAVEAILHRHQDNVDQGSNMEVTLLLVEDDMELAEVFRSVVESWPFPVHFIMAGNGFEGLIKAGLHKPNLIIADLVMPAMDGFQMIRNLRETPDLKETTLVVVTALTDRQIQERGGLPPDVPVFQKPVSFKQIQAVVEKLVRLPGSCRYCNRKDSVEK